MAARSPVPDKVHHEATSMKPILFAVLAALALAGCSSGNQQQSSASSETKSKPAATQPTAKATETKPGRAAFQETFIAARGWARDAQPFLEESQPTSDATGNDGKSAVWTARFGSVMRGSG